MTLRDLGEYVRIVAQNCAAQCDSRGTLEPLLIDRKGGCRLLRPQAR